MFELVDEYKFWRTVTVRVPDPERPDAFVEDSFKVQFKALPDERLKEIGTRYRTATADERAVQEHALLHEVVVAWDGVSAGGKPLSFSRNNLDRALKFPFIARAFYDAYRAALAGEDGQAGN